MSTSFKYFACKAGSAVAITLILYSLSRMLGPGMAGQTHEVWRWFAVCIGGLVLGCAAVLGTLYYRSLVGQPRLDTNEAEVFAAAAAEVESEKQAARSQSDKPH